MEQNWKMATDLLREGVLDEATARGLSVSHPGGSRTVFEFPEGLAEEHYRRFAPLLRDDCEKSDLALGVLENLLQISPVDWMEVKGKLWQEWGDYDTWLPDLIDAEGLQAVADRIAQWIKMYRRDHPAIRVEITGIVHPIWDSEGGLLCFGNKTWKFRAIAGPLKDLLDEFEKKNWKSSIKLPHVHEGPVRDVAKELRKRTKGYIKWHGSADGTLGWSWDM